MPRCSFVLGACLFGVFVSALPAHADPISLVTFPFSVRVTGLQGPTERLFGASLQRGDTLSGRFVFDGPSSSADTIEDPSHGAYFVFGGHVEFDVASALTLRPTGLPISAIVVDNHVFDHDSLYDGFGLGLDSTAAGFAVNFSVSWYDLSTRAFASDVLPLDDRGLLSRFEFSELQLVAFDESVQLAIVVQGTSDPVPEPATWLLLGPGVAYLLARRRRSDPSRV